MCHKFSRRDFMYGLGAAGLACSFKSSFAAHANQPATPINELVNEQYDYIIVGAGSAGCPLVAQLLSHTKGKILLV